VPEASAAVVGEEAAAGDAEAEADGRNPPGM